MKKSCSSDYVTVGFSATSEQSSRPQPLASKKEPLATENNNASLLVFGAAAVDISANAFEMAPNFASGSTVPGTIAVSLGGVARNIAEASHRVSPKGSVLLVAPIGNDAFGHLLTEETANIGMRTDGLLLQKNQRTAVCNMIMDSHGGLTTGIADMAILETEQFQTEVRRINPIREWKLKMSVGHWNDQESESHISHHRWQLLARDNFNSRKVMH